MAAVEKEPIPAEQDLIYVAIGLHWSREILSIMSFKNTMEKRLVADGHLSAAGRWHAAHENIERAAFEGREPPESALTVVRGILSEHRAKVT